MGRMKDSGVEWIGEIPEEWEICKLKNMGKLTGGCGFPVELQGNADKYYPFYKVGDLELSSDGRNMNQALNTLDEEERIKLGAKIIEKYSIIYAKIGAALLLNKRRITSQPCLIDNNMSAFMPFKDIDVIWAYYVLSIINLGWYMASGAIPAVSEGTQSQIAVPLPSKETQQKISTYLDRKCAQIDAILSSIQHSIEKLKEYRQAIITQAVTKGLDPDVRMKDSGVEWIGEIPEGWEVKRIKSIFKVIPGSTPKSDNADFWDGIYTWITPLDFSEDTQYISESKKYLTEAGITAAGLELLPKGSIVLTTRAPIGEVALVNSDFCTNQGCKSLIKKSSSIDKFFYYVLVINKDELNTLGNGSTFLELSTTSLENFVLPYPPISIQQEISEYLDQKTAQIDSLIAEKQKLHDKITTYKKSLIYEYVTGKREVPDDCPE